MDIDIDVDLSPGHPGETALDWDAITMKAAGATLAFLPDYADLTPSFTLLICDDARIRELNSDFRDKDKPTNVLSFPQFPADAVPDAGEHYIGDIALSYDTLRAEADAGGLALADHATHLIVHSVLHLFGYDHMEDSEAEEMEALEAGILGTMGIKNPYL
jgi:probable rRNA maturation factor